MNWFKFFRLASSSKHKMRGVWRPNRSQLVLEGLEDRSVPATCIWTGADVPDQDNNADGDTVDPGESGNLRWSDPLNWAGGLIPGFGGSTTDDVIFPDTVPTFSKNYGGVDGPNSLMDLNVTINSLTIAHSGYRIVDSAPQEPVLGPVPTIPSQLRTLTVTGSITYTGSPDTTGFPQGSRGYNGISEATFRTQLARGANSEQPFVTLQPTGTLIFGGHISTAPTLTSIGIGKEGPGTLSLGGTNDFDGVVEVKAGTLVVTSNQALGSTNVGTFVANGATLTVNTANLSESIQIMGTGVGGAALNGVGGISGGIALTPSATIGGALTITGVVSGSGDLTSTGFLTLANANTYLGQTLVTSGTLTITHNDALSPGNLTRVSAGATLELLGHRVVDDEDLYLNGGTLLASTARDGSVSDWQSPIYLSAPSSISADETAALILSGPLANTSNSFTASLTKIGKGQALFPNANPDFHGDMIISNGILIMPRADVLGPATSAGQVGDPLTGGSIIVNYDLATATGGTLLVTGQFTSQKAVTIRGMGYSGFNPATLVLPLPATPTPTGKLTGAGALRLFQPATGPATTIKWNAPITVGTTADPSGSTGVIFGDAGTSLTVNGIIGGAAGQNLQKAGAGSLKITNANTFLGTLTLLDGTTTITNSEALGGVGGDGTVVSSGATLAMSDGLTVEDETLTLSSKFGVPATLQVGKGASLWTGLVNLVGNGFTGITGEADILVTDPAATLTFTNVVSGDARLRKLGDGEFRLYGTQANTFIGTLQLDAGRVALGKPNGVNALAGDLVIGDGVGGNSVDRLRFDASNQIPDNSKIRVNSSGFFNLNGKTETVGPLALQGGEVQTFAGSLILSTDVTTLGGPDASVITGNLFLGSTTRTFNFLPGPASSFASSANPAESGKVVRFTFDVAYNPGDPIPTGTVEFYDGITRIGTTTLGTAPPPGPNTVRAAFQTTSLSVGTHIISAKYLGDSNYSSLSVELAQPQLIVNPPASLSLTSSAIPSLPGQDVTFTFQAAGSAIDPIPTGSVDFFDGAVKLNATPIALAGGVATITTNTLTVGMHTIVAVYTGDSSYSASSVTLANQQVGSPAIIQVSSSADPVPAGSNVIFTFNASGELGTPQGTVTFYVDSILPANQIGTPQTLTGGIASVSTSTLAAGTHDIIAVYSGDTNYLPGQTNLVPQQMVGTHVVLQITSSKNQSVDKESVTFTVTATGSNGPVTGSVQFFDNGTPLGILTALAGGTATTTSTTLAVGNHTITASYMGSATYLPDTVMLLPGQSVIATPNPSSGTIFAAVSSDNNSSESGQNVTFTYTAYPASGGAAATGNVQFSYSTTGPGGTFLPIGGVQALVPGGGAISTAQASSASLPVGNITIKATYSNGNYGSGDTFLAPVQIVNNPLVAELTSNQNPVPPGSSLTFTFNAVFPAGGPSPATGANVRFFDGAIQIGSQQSLTVSGNTATASVTTNALTVGTHTITAVYSGNNSYAAKTVTLTPSQIVGAPPAMMLSSDNNPVIPGGLLTFTFTATPPATGAVPSGTVTFFDNGVALSTQTLTLGSASYITNSLTPGSHVITATYSGDLDYVGGTVSLLPNQIVNDPPAVQLTADVNPALVGQTVTFTTQISRKNLTDPAPTGTVTFYNGSVSLANQIGVPQTVSLGIAQVSTNTLPLGTDTIIAVYSGDTNYAAQTLYYTQTITLTPVPVSPPPTVVAKSDPLLVVNSPIAGGLGAGIIKTGVGSMTLNAANTYTGPTTINGDGGSLVLGVNNALPDTALTIKAGTLDVNGKQDAVASLTGTLPGIINLNGGNFTTGLDNSSTTYGGAITGTGYFRKVGTGTLTLAGSSPTYTGTTVAFSGTLLVLANQGNAAVIVRNGATLGGTGPVGDVSVDAGGRLSPGSSPAILTTGAVTLVPGSQFIVEANGPNPGTGYDQLNATGNVNLNGATLDFRPAPALAINDTFVIVKTTATVTGTFAGLTNGQTFIMNNHVYQIVYTAQDVTITLVGLQSSMALTSDLNPAQPTQTITFSATVTPTVPGPVPAGTVSFYDGATLLGSGTLNGSGVATYATTLATGTHTITAKFQSVTSPTAQYVAPDATLVQSVTVLSTTTIVAAQGPVYAGAPATFVASVAQVSGQPIPTGTITFVDLTTNTVLGAAALDAAGNASFTTTALRPDVSTVQAVYSGNTFYRASSGTVDQVIKTNERIVTGTDTGTVATVLVYNALTRGLIREIHPFDAYTLGVKVATGDVNHDGFADIIVSAGAGAPGGHVKIFDGKTFGEIASFFTFPGYNGGVNIASGDVDGDGYADVIIGTAQANDHVKVFSGHGLTTGAGPTASTLMSFFAYGAGNTVGVTVAAGDVNGDGRADVITGSATFAGHVKAFQAMTGQLIGSYFAYGAGYLGGINVAAGDVNGDGRAEIITGATNAPHVKVLNLAGQELASFFAYPGSPFGARVASTDRDGDGKADIITGAGGSAPHVKIFNGQTLQLLDSFYAVAPGQPVPGTGVFVGASDSDSVI